MKQSQRWSFAGALLLLLCLVVAQGGLAAWQPAPAAPLLTISPDSLTYAQRQGWVTDHTFTLTNNGLDSRDFQVALDQPSGTVLMLHLEESGAVVETFADSSPFANIGYCHGDSCPLAGGLGVYGRGLSFDGNDLVQTPVHGFSSGSSNRTMAGWVRLNAYSHTGKSAFFFGYGTFGTPGGVYALQMDGATLKFSQWDQELVGPDLELNRWYHVAVTNTGTAVTIYVDGDPAVSGTLPLNTQVGTPFIIGSETAPAGRHLNGYLDEIMVVNRALTPLEVKSLYQFGGVVDVPWLAVSPLSGAIPAGGSLPLVVQLIATATPPGLYRTNLVVWSSPGGERLTIPIELRIWNTIYLPLANN